MKALFEQFPAEIEWLVAFRLAPVVLDAAGGLTAELIFRLDPDLHQADDAFVVLTALGRYLVGFDGQARPGDAATPQLTAPGRANLAERHAELLAHLPVHRADCVGLGSIALGEPVAMVVEMVAGLGSATAAFARMPTCAHYELLPAVGVRRMDIENVAGGPTLVRFENRLPEHLLAGLVSGFARTHHCNLFFLRHGRIDAELEQGLLAAGEARLKLAVRLLQATAVRAGLEARTGGRAMICLPPPPQAPFPYGDLVPLGLLLRALSRFPEDKAVEAGAQLLRRHLDRHRQGALWSFHAGGLATATDSALILLGHGDPAGVRELDRFGVEGGIVPQLSDEVERPGHMRAGPENVHWRQPDFATTCLVRWLRREAGLPDDLSFAALAQRFADRSGLFFANPYLVDWCLAEAVRDDPAAAGIRTRLGEEIAASANEDFSFGRYDVAFSTALAILALAALGRRGRLLRAAQLRLLQEVDGAAPAAPAIPFYYTFVAGAPDGGLPVPVHRRIAVAGQLHDLHLLEDSYRIVTTGVLLLALSEACDPSLLDLPEPDRTPHPRYACRTVADYVRMHALPPYLRRTDG